MPLLSTVLAVGYIRILDISMDAVYNTIFPKLFALTGFSSPGDFIDAVQEIIDVIIFDNVLYYPTITYRNVMDWIYNKLPILLAKPFKLLMAALGPVFDTVMDIKSISGLAGIIELINNFTGGFI